MPTACRRTKARLDDARDRSIQITSAEGGVALRVAGRGRAIDGTVVVAARARLTDRSRRAGGGGRAIRVAIRSLFAGAGTVADSVVGYALRIFGAVAAAARTGGVNVLASSASLERAAPQGAGCLFGDARFGAGADRAHAFGADAARFALGLLAHPVRVADERAATIVWIVVGIGRAVARRLSGQREMAGSAGACRALARGACAVGALAEAVDTLAGRSAAKARRA
jgi:hypothetical protein